MQNIGQGAVTSRARQILRQSDEGMVWEDSPTPMLLFGTAVKWALVNVAAFLWAAGSGSGWGWVLIWMLAATVHLALKFFELKGTRYRMTSQRLEMTAGMFTRATVTYELHHLGDATIVSPFLLRQVGRANLLVRGLNRPLLGIREPEIVRDLLRDSGQWEAQRIDKIRWR
jgi:hypothetical protein